MLKGALKGTMSSSLKRHRQFFYFFLKRLPVLVRDTVVKRIDYGISLALGLFTGMKSLTG
jgi:hypothetical protein